MEALVGYWKSVGCEGVLLKPYFGWFFTLFHSFVGSYRTIRTGRTSRETTTNEVFSIAINLLSDLSDKVFCQGTKDLCRGYYS